MAGDEIDDYKKGPPQLLVPKEFAERELEYRFRYLTVVKMSKNLLLLGVCACISSVIFASLGVILVLYGDRGESTLNLFGQDIRTGSVGVACVAVGAIALVMLIRTIVRTMGQMSAK